METVSSLVMFIFMSAMFVLAMQDGLRGIKERSGR